MSHQLPNLPPAPSTLRQREHRAAIKERESMQEVSVTKMLHVITFLQHNRAVHIMVL